MKKQIILLAIVLLFISVGAYSSKAEIDANILTQDMIENPKTPQNENAGRMLKLKEEFRIGGEGEGYYFNGARELLLDGSGNIYICDSWSTQQRSHLLKFSPEGAFVKGRILKIDGDFLYSAESDEDDLPLIVKYRILQ